MISLFFIILFLCFIQNCVCDVYEEEGEECGEEEESEGTELLVNRVKFLNLCTHPGPRSDGWPVSVVVDADIGRLRTNAVAAVACLENPGIKLYFFAFDGTMVGTPTLISDSGQHPSVTFLSKNYSLVVAYELVGNIYFVRTSANRQDSPIEVVTVPGDGYDRSPFVANLPHLTNSGVFAITYFSDAGAPKQYNMRRIFLNLYDAATGLVYRPAAYVNEYQNSSSMYGSHYPRIAVLKDNSFVIAWETYGIASAGAWGQYARHYDTSGYPVGNYFQVNANIVNQEYDTDIVALPDGGYGICWHSSKPPSSYSYRRFDKFDKPTLSIERNLEITTTYGGYKRCAMTVLEPFGHYKQHSLFVAAEAVNFIQAQIYNECGTLIDPVASVLYPNSPSTMIFANPAVGSLLMGNTTMVMVAFANHASNSTIHTEPLDGIYLAVYHLRSSTSPVTSKSSPTHHFSYSESTIGGTTSSSTSSTTYPLTTSSTTYPLTSSSTTHHLAASMSLVLPMFSAPSVLSSLSTTTFTEPETSHETSIVDVQSTPVAVELTNSETLSPTLIYIFVAVGACLLLTTVCGSFVFFRRKSRENNDAEVVEESNANHSNLEESHYQGVESLLAAGAATEYDVVPPESTVYERVNLDKNDLYKSIEQPKHDVYEDMNSPLE